MKIKNLVLIFTLFLTAAGYSLAQSTIFPTKPWNATVKAVGEDGQPINAAGVSVFFTLPPLSFPDDSGKYNGKISGITDANGLFTATHVDQTGALRFQIQKAGYYSSGYSRTLRDPMENANDRDISITLILKKIGNPIPMYAKRAEMKLQQVGEPMGFDLEAGDWVTPYGKGFHTDIIFTLLHRQIISRMEYDCGLTVTFPNQGDGITVTPPEVDTGSEFKTARMAITNGYEPELNFQYSNTNQPPSVFGYFIRVRTELNPDGSIKSALYGKIDGGFRFYAGTIKPTSGMSFTYYLNSAPNDRNVEFDPKRNLVRDLKPLEGVSAP